MASRRTHAQRVEQGRARFLAAHPNASQTEATAYARGHWATPEHGYTVRDLGPGAALYEVYAAQDVKRMLGDVELRYGTSARIMLTVHDAYGTRQFFRNVGRGWGDRQGGRGGGGGGMNAGHARTVLWQYSRDFARGMAVLLSGKPGSYSDEKIKLKFRKVQTIQIAVQVPIGSPSGRGRRQASGGGAQAL